MTKIKNRTYQICTLDKHLDCSSCSIAAYVDCSRHKPTQMVQFYKMVALFVIPGIIILVLASFILKLWWLLPGYLLYWFIYQIISELLIRCRHCPFWDEANPKLDCRINCGVPKLNWLKPKSLIRYNPAPLTLCEKIVIQALSTLTFIIPLVIATITIIRLIFYGNSILMVLLIVLFVICQIGTAIYFIRYLTRRLCPTCIHFSCPNNHQPYHIIKDYLTKNNSLYKAWEKDLHKYVNRK